MPVAPPAVIPPDVAEWITKGRDDIALFALRGLGIALHPAQVEIAQWAINGDAQYILATWANRAGKTTVVGVMHLHRLWYRLGTPQPTTMKEYEEWLATDYRTLHAAPLNELAARAHTAWGEILAGVSRAQWDESKSAFRAAPLAPFFSMTRERDVSGADHMFMRAVNGAVCDFRSTEGKARRLESGTWRLLTWDEWSQSENPGDIRDVLYIRLTNRAADYDAPIVLTGTISVEVEHIAQEFIDYCEDPENTDWIGNSAPRSLNPNASTKAIARAERNLDPEDYARTVMGIPGGAKGRLFPPYMVTPIFDNDLPRFTPPHPGDGVTFDGPDPFTAAARTFNRRNPDGSVEVDLSRMPRGQWKARGQSPWTYLHLWDVAIAVADNVGMVLRIPADWHFGYQEVEGKTTFRPIEGVSMKVIPGSRTLTSAEIIHTIEETFLPYGGLIVVDTTDAHGKNIFRELRRAGYPVEAFTFNERDQRRVIRKDAAILHTRELLTEGMEVRRDKAGEMLHDPDGIPDFDKDKPYGVLHLPKSWTKPKDQLSLLRVDDDRQRKDAAMTVLMGGDVAYRTRRVRTRRTQTSRFRVFGRS